jgi:hypothetical protein
MYVHICLPSEKVDHPEDAEDKESDGQPHLDRALRQVRLPGADLMNQFRPEFTDKT